MGRLKKGLAIAIAGAPQPGGGSFFTPPGGAARRPVRHPRAGILLGRREGAGGVAGRGMGMSLPSLGILRGSAMGRSAIPEDSGLPGTAGGIRMSWLSGTLGLGP